MGNATSFRGDTKWFRERVDNKVKCRCGHSMAFPYDKEKMVCSWCGRYVYKSKKIEFEETLKSKIKLQK